MELRDLTDGQLAIVKASIRIMLCCIRRLNNEDLMIGTINERAIILCRICEHNWKSVGIILHELKFIVHNNPAYHQKEVKGDCKMIPINFRGKLITMCDEIMVHNYHPMEINMHNNITKWLREA